MKWCLLFFITLHSHPPFGLKLFTRSSTSTIFSPSNLFAFAPRPPFSITNNLPMTTSVSLVACAILISLPNGLTNSPLAPLDVSSWDILPTIEGTVVLTYLRVKSSCLVMSHLMRPFFPIMLSHLPLPPSNPIFSWTRISLLNPPWHNYEIHNTIQSNRLVIPYSKSSHPWLIL